MKTTKILSLASALALGAMSLDALAIATIGTGTNSGAAGATVTIPLSYTRPAGDPFNVFSATWRINHTNPPITFVSFAPGTPPTAASVACGAGGGNTFTTCVLTTNPPTAIAVGTYNLGTITYQIAAGATPGVQNLPTTVIECTDAGGNEIAGACNASSGSITITGGNVPPNIAYNPVTGTTINYTGAGTASAIVATPSGGSGSGAAATTTVGACTITGGGAAFPTTNIAQLSFVGATVTAQNINLPNCVPQPAAVNATLTCPESQGGAAAVNRVWTLNCPAQTPVGPNVAYNPAAGASAGLGGPVNFTGVTTVGTTGNGQIVATPSGGVNSGTTTVNACAFSGGDAANFAGAGAVNLTFTAGVNTPQNINLTCTSGAAARTTNLQCTETISGGATTSRFWVLNCPAGAPANVPPNIAYNPVTGTTINYTGGGTASAIVATPSGGSGSGAAATTTVGACTITGGGAAFPTTNIAQLSFVGATVTPQNINLPNCVAQPAAVNATLTCPESQGGAAAVNRVWTLNCPAQGAVGPNMAYNPAAGASAGLGGPVNFTGVTTVGTIGNGQIVATPSGGVNSGTTTVNACAFSGGDAANFAGAGAVNLTFTAGVNTPQNINLTCTSGAAARTTNLQCTETITGGATTSRFWVLNCPAGAPANVPPNIAYNPVTGTTINYTGGGTASAIVATPSGGSGSGAAATTTVGACTITGGGAAFPTTNIAQLSFVGATVTPQNINLPNCVPQPAAVNATLTCPESQGGAAAVNRVWTLNCPAQGAVGPDVAYNPLAGASAGLGGPVNFTGVTTVGSTGNGQIVATPSGGVNAGTTTVNACAFSGGDAANFAGAGAVNLTFTAGVNTPQNINLSCTAGAAARTTNLQCTETITGGATTSRFWVLNCPAGAPANVPPTIAYNPVTGTIINYTGAGTATAIIATPSGGGSGSGAAATTTVGACTITGGGAAFPTTNIAQLSFVGATVTPQNINLPNCVPQAAAVNATLTCPESQGGAAAVNRVWTLNCPAGAAAVPPTLIYQPAPGNVTISGAVGASVVQTFDVSCNGVAGGSGACTGSGAAPGNTARLSNLTVTGFSPSSLTCAFANEAGAPVASPLDFVAGAADPGDIRCSCVIPAINQNYIVSVTETPNLSAPGTTVQRQWNVTCGAGGVCGSLTANPASGAALSFTAPTGTTQTVTFTPAGGAVVSQTLSCTIGGANPGAFAFNSPATFPITFPPGSTTSQNVVLGCTNNTLNPQNATLSCTRTCDTATTTFNYTLTCPPQAAPPVADAIPVPTMSESGRVLLAALVLLLGLAVVGVRLRG